MLLMLQVLIIFKSCSVCYFENKIKIYKRENKMEQCNGFLQYISHICI